MEPISFFFIQVMLDLSSLDLPYLIFRIRIRTMPHELVRGMFYAAQ